ncbi:Smr/MutS family protein [Desulfovibrio sp.]
MTKRMKSLSDLKSLTLESKDDKPAPITARSVKAALKAAGGKPIHVTPPKPKEAPAPVADPAEDEADLFLNAMRGVDRIHEEQGRQVAARPAAPEPVAPPAADDEAQALARFLRGEIDFELEFSEEYMHGVVRGLDRKIFQMLKNGRLSHEAHLDMHGLNADQAYDGLLFFLRESYLQGRRCVLLITGRGKNSPGGQSILKREIQTWLTREPLRRAVLAFCTAQPKDGGAGALYVLLRKVKKSQGKVRWDTLTNWEPDDR